MTKTECFEGIINERKWHVGLFSDNYAVLIKKRYKEGTLSNATIEKVLKHFGYRRVQEEIWTKTPVKQMARKVRY